jgi:hypothetical protein
MKHFHAEIERGGNTNRFKSPKLEIKVSMPCESCNHGWMSGLENQVKPFMTQTVYRGEMTLLDPDRHSKTSTNAGCLRRRTRCLIPLGDSP